MSTNENHGTSHTSKAGKTEMVLPSRTPSRYHGGRKLRSSPHSSPTKRKKKKRKNDSSAMTKILLSIVVGAMCITWLRISAKVSFLLTPYYDYLDSTSKMLSIESIGMNRQRRITLVQGGGYIGAYIAEKFTQQGQLSVQIFDNRKGVPASLFPKGHDPTFFDLGTASTVLFLGEPKVGDVTQTTVQDDVIAVLERMDASQHLIVMSTALAGMDATETGFVNATVLPPLSLAFYEREQAILAYHKKRTKKLQPLAQPPRITILRLGSLVGLSPSYRTDDIIPHMFADAYSRGRVHVVNGGETKSFLSLHDLARTINVLVTANPAREGKEVEFYNVASFQAKEVKVANTIASMTGAKVEVSNWLGPGLTISTARIQQKLGLRFESTLTSVLEELESNVPASITPSGPYELVDDDPNSMPCPVCGSRHHQVVLDIGHQPFANDFQEDVEKALASPRFPLKLIRCKVCNHLHLAHLADRDDLFNHYLYQSATSRTLANYFQWLADKVIRDSGIRYGGNVLEIACNDGTQLNFFREAGWQTFGVDPAANLVPLAVQKGHNVKVGFWGADLDFPELPTGDYLHAIVAQNVYAHVPDNVAFLKKCEEVMGPKTRLYIQTSQCHMHQLGQFDTAYHEHVSFFTAHSFQKAAELAGLVITEFELTPIHGTSCLVTMMLPGWEQRRVDNSTTLQDRLALEVKQGITSDYFYERYRARALHTRRWMVAQLSRLQHSGHQIIAYGAAAKGMVLLHFFMESPEASEIKIEFILDDARLKQDRFCAGTNIPVRPTSSIRQYTSNRRPLVILVLAWNFWDEIAVNIKRELQGHIDEALVLLPFPTPRLVLLKTGTPVAENPVVLSMPFNPPEIPNALARKDRRRAVVVVDICKEGGFLMMQFMMHHAHMFDYAIVVNECKSPHRDLILGDAPTTWHLLENDISGPAIQHKIKSLVSGGPGPWVVNMTTSEFLVQSRFRDELMRLDSGDAAATTKERLRQLCMIPAPGETIDHGSPHDIMTMYHNFFIKAGGPAVDVQVMGEKKTEGGEVRRDLQGFVAKFGCSRGAELAHDFDEVSLETGSTFLSEYHADTF